MTAQSSEYSEAFARDGVAVIPLVLHASSKATGAGLRRVLHFVFGPASLPYGLQWALSV